MKKLIRKWLGIVEIDNKMYHLKKTLNKQVRKSTSFDERIRKLHTKLNSLNKL